jgi:hypothetical protein
MSVSTPPLLLQAIASLAGSGFITAPLPATPTGTNAASISNGFPPVVMENELAGGKPPLGQDINGFLFLLSSHTLYVETGQTYQFNADLAAEIGGYPVGTILGMADDTGLWLCTSADNSNDPDSDGSGWIGLSSYGFSTVAVTGGTEALGLHQSKYPTLVFNGILSSNQIVNLPASVQQWLIINNTSGNFTLTVNTGASGSVGVAIPQGSFGSPVGVYSVGDGNIYPTVAPLSLPIDQNPTASTIVQRTNAGYVLATYFNGNAGLENPNIGAVIVQNLAADGFFRKIGLTNFEAQLMIQGFGGQVSNGQLPFSAVAQWAAGLFASPTFTGAPITPPVTQGTTTNQVAPCSFACPPFNVAPTLISYKLPSGIIRYSGQTVISGTGTITFPNGGFPNACTSFVFSIVNSTNQLFLQAGSPTKTQAVVTNGSATINWQAEGY